MIILLKNILDQWKAWRKHSFPSVVPVPEVREIPGRDALLAQLEEVRANDGRDRALRQDEIQAITTALGAAQERVWLVQKDLTELYQKDWLSNLQADSNTERLRALILEKAPISLGLFIEELDKELTRLRQTQPTIAPNGCDRDYALMRKTMRFQTNAGSIRRRVTAVQSARERAVAMQMENMSVQEILGEVQRLRQSLPEIVDEETRGPLAGMLLRN